MGTREGIIQGRVPFYMSIHPSIRLFTYHSRVHRRRLDRGGAQGRGRDRGAGRRSPQAGHDARRPLQHQRHHRQDHRGGQRQGGSGVGGRQAAGRAAGVAAVLLGLVWFVWFGSVWFLGLAGWLGWLIGLADLVAGRTCRSTLPSNPTRRLRASLRGQVAPKAAYLIISNPVNSTVPIFAEVLKKAGACLRAPM